MVRRFLGLLKEHSGEGYKSWPRQVLDVLELVARGHLHPAEYFQYGLSKRGISMADASVYMSNRYHWQDHLGTLNDPRWFGLMDDKWQFHLHFRDIAPLPRMLGIYHPVGGLSWDYQRLQTVNDLVELLDREGVSSFVLKPVRGSQGTGVSVVDEVTRDSQDVVFGLRDGSRQAASAVLKVQNGIPTRRADGFLVEECLSNHPVVHEIAPYAVNTIRVVTLVGRNEISVPVACIRLGSAGSMVDNFSGGGYCAAVDVASGRIGRGRRRSTPGAERETHHADSGVRFAGVEVPFWRDVVSVCVKAAAFAPGLRTIGWDVVVTPSGPVVIEGNRDWGIMMCQAVGGGYLQPDVAAELRHLGVPVTPDRLPKINPPRAISSLFGTWR